MTLLTTPLVAVQIVNYKTKAFLDPLIESVLRDVVGSDLSVEINILDNASGDDLSDIAEKYGDQNVRVYNSTQNNGFGAGNNYLAKRTKAEYLLLLNPDTFLTEKHTIQRLLQTMHLTHATVVGPRLLIPRSRQHLSLRHLQPEQLKHQPWDNGSSFTIGTWRYSKERADKVAWVSGAAFLITRQKFEAVGGFDEKFFLYFEEVDLCWRLQKRRYFTVYDPQVQILHYGSAAVKSSKLKHLLKSAVYFHRKRLRLSKKQSL